jgi:hypothetical protein
MSSLFVTVVKKYSASAYRFSKGTHSMAAAPRRLFHDGFIFSLSQASISNILNQILTL